MIDVILFEPEIPPNTGNVIRLCANTGARLHLVEPLGFSWDDARVKRAGLDYHAATPITRHAWHIWIIRAFSRSARKRRPVSTARPINPAMPCCSVRKHAACRRIYCRHYLNRNGSDYQCDPGSAA